MQDRWRPVQTTVDSSHLFQEMYFPDVNVRLVSPPQFSVRILLVCAYQLIKRSIFVLSRGFGYIRSSEFKYCPVSISSSADSLMTIYSIQLKFSVSLPDFFFCFLLSFFVLYCLHSFNNFVSLRFLADFVFELFLLYFVTLLRFWSLFLSCYPRHFRILSCFVLELWIFTP